MKGKFVNALLMTILVILVAGGAFAQTPANTILYQGKLTDDTGAPITTATSVQFTIYTALVGGSNLFSTTVPALTPDENGLFTVELGPLSTTVLNGDKRYLGIKVGSDAEMTPRQLLTSSPASHTALSSVNQPGYAYNAPTDANTLVLLTGAGDAYAACVLDAPTSGYAYVTANAMAFINHTTGTWENVILKISTTQNDVSSSNNSTVIRVPASLPTGAQIYVYPVSLTAIIPVSAGTNTFYFNAFESSGSSDANDYLLAPKIIAVFVPSFYDDSKSIELPQTLEPEIDPYLGHEIEEKVTKKKADAN